MENTALAENYKPMDLLPIATSIRYRFTDHLCIEGRYESSMLSISKQEGQGSYRILRSNKGTFSHVLTIGLAYQF